jgi:DNA-binding CsgD family transcriptional regulator/PAS domain-containing protein
LPTGSVLLGVASGIDPAWLVRLPAYGDDIVETWGGDERISQFPLEEPIVQSQAVTDVALRASRFFTEWVRPQGVMDAVAIGLERNSRMVSTLSFGRHDQAGAVTDIELAGLRLIAPHIRRALAISQALEIQTIKASQFTATLEAFSVGVVIVDEDATVIHTNAAAQAMLEASDPIFVRAGRIGIPAAAAAATLKSAVMQAARNETELGKRGGVGIPAPRRDGAPCIVHVFPLRRRESRFDLVPRAAAALFIADAATPPQLPADALALLYGLTPAETRVFEMIVAGGTQSDIAKKLGLAVSTIKTHLLRVFEKAGCKRQADLVRLASSLSVPTRANLEATDLLPIRES